MFFFNHFRNIWATPNSTNLCSLNLTNFPSIPNACEDELLKPFSIEEIRAALWSMPLGKAPGPDGFQVEFFRCFWDQLGSGIGLAFEKFHATDPSLWGQTFVTLVPKRPNPSKVEE